MKDDSFVSVLMPVKDREDFLVESIQSILGQTHTNLELVVIDDHSTDGSRELVANLQKKDARIRLLNNAGHGVAAARNTAIANAEGDYIAWMDSDDISELNRIEVQLAWMKANKIELCGTLARRFGKISDVLAFPEDQRSIEIELMFRSSMLQPTLMMPIYVAQRLDYKEGIEFEDYEWLTRAVLKFRAGNIQQPLLRWRIHSQQTHSVRASDFLNTHKISLFQYAGKAVPDLSSSEYLAIVRLWGENAPKNAVDFALCGRRLALLAGEVNEPTRERLAKRWKAHFRRYAEQMTGDDSAAQKVFDKYQQKILHGEILSPC